MKRLPVPSYEPSNAVTMMWTAFGVQFIATLYVISRGIILAENARQFHVIFGIVGLVASFAYLMEAGALEYIDLLHDDNLSAEEHASVWRLPCNTRDLDYPHCDNANETPMCTIIPYYLSRIVIQSLMVYGIAVLAGTPKKEHIAAITCVVLMETSNFIATFFKSLYESISIISIWAFCLRLFFMVPLLYFLLHGIEQNIRRAPLRVRGVCHGWCFMMVIIQVWTLFLWCIAYGTTIMSLTALLACRIIADMMNTVVIPLLVLRDNQLLLMVRDRDERVGALSKIAQRPTGLGALFPGGTLPFMSPQGGYDDPMRLPGTSVTNKGGLYFDERLLVDLYDDKYISNEEYEGYDVPFDEDEDEEGRDERPDAAEAFISLSRESTDAKSLACDWSSRPNINSARESI